MTLARDIVGRADKIITIPLNKDVSLTTRVICHVMREEPFAPKIAKLNNIQQRALTDNIMTNIEIMGMLNDDDRI